MRAVKLVVGIVITLFFMSGCDNRELVIDEFTQFEEESWSNNDTLNFKFDVEDISYMYNVYVNLRIKNDYKYANLYLQTKLNHISEKSEFERRHLLLAAPNGKWFGSGRGEIITLQIPIDKNVVFKKTGRYYFQMVQEMRDSSLQNVLNAGIMVEKGPLVF